MGQIINQDVNEDNGEDIWRIRFEDWDEADYNLKEVKEGMRMGTDAHK